MTVNKNLAYLLLCVAIGLPQYAVAGAFCATTPDGKARLDECRYASYVECKLAVGNQANCMADPAELPPASGAAPYCIVTWSVECKYYDYETCNQTAQKKVGFCYLNPDYKAPDKQ